MSPSNIEARVADIQARVPSSLWADAMITQLQVAVCHTDSRGYFLEVNQAYCDLYGYRAEELLGKHFTIVVPEAYREVAAAIHDGFIQGADELPAEWTVVDRFGKAMRIWATPVRCQDDDGQTSKITLVERVEG